MTDETLLSKADLLTRIEAGWQRFNDYLQSLSAAQFTQPTDAAGWTVKDHVMHLAVWEDGIVALLHEQSRHERMGVSAEVWQTRDYDVINGVIQQQHQDRSLDAVLATFSSVHQQLVETIAGLSDDDLHRPYRDYQPGSDNDTPVIGYIIGDTYEHYDEHHPWIAAIAAADTTGDQA